MRLHRFVPKLFKNRLSLSSRNPINQSDVGRRAKELCTLLVSAILRVVKLAFVHSNATHHAYPSNFALCGTQRYRVIPSTVSRRTARKTNGLFAIRDTSLGVVVHYGIDPANNRRFRIANGNNVFAVSSGAPRRASYPTGFLQLCATRLPGSMCTHVNLPPNFVLLGQEDRARGVLD